MSLLRSCPRILYSGLLDVYRCNVASFTNRGYVISISARPLIDLPFRTSALSRDTIKYRSRLKLAGIRRFHRSKSPRAFLSVPPLCQAIYTYLVWPSFSRLHDNHTSRSIIGSRYWVTMFRQAHVLDTLVETNRNQTDTVNRLFVNNHSTSLSILNRSS